MLNERQKEIVKYLSEEKRDKVENLAERFKVSIETIRRDLIILEKESYIRRIHGGAVYGNLRGQELVYEERSERNFSEKRGIARLATDYTSDGGK